MIEVMLGIVMVAACALVFAATMPVAYTARGKADHRNVALSIAQKEMEAIKALGYARIDPNELHDAGLLDSSTAWRTNWYWFSNVDNGNVHSAADTLPRGRARIRIRQPQTDMREVVVFVQWRDDKGNRWKNVKIATLVANI